VIPPARAAVQLAAGAYLDDDPEGEVAEALAAEFEARR
jgi:hypothetical protein